MPHLYAPREGKPDVCGICGFRKAQHGPEHFDESGLPPESERRAYKHAHGFVEGFLDTERCVCGAMRGHDIHKSQS